MKLNSPTCLFSTNHEFFFSLGGYPINMRSNHSRRVIPHIDLLETRRLLATYSIERFGGDIDDINPDTRTWVLAHGWLGEPDDLEDIADAILESATHGNDQVLAIDWSESADTPLNDPGAAEDAIPAVADFASSELTSMGFDGSTLNFIGHSYGAYVAAETVERMGAEVESLWALDPGQDLPGDYSSNDSADFSLNNKFSWAWHASSFYGSISNPATADESYVFNIPGSDIVQHNKVVNICAAFFENEASMPIELRVERLLDSSVAPFFGVKNRYNANGIYDTDGEYDGVMYTESNESIPMAVRYSSSSLRYTRGIGTGEDNEINAIKTDDGMTLDRDETSIDFTLESTEVVIIEGGEGKDEITASTMTRGVSLKGNAGDDSLNGGSGNDSLFGGADRDELRGGPGNDLLAGESHADSIWGGDGIDSLVGASGNDYLRGEGGDDSLNAGGGSDQLRGHGGNDLLIGGGSNDKFYGGDGNDTIYGNDGLDRIYGDAGEDTAYTDDEDELHDVEIEL